MKEKENRYLEWSAVENSLVGRDPRDMPLEDLRHLGHPTSPVKAIRAKCIDCCADQQSEVRRCVSTTCALWPLRMNANPFHTRSTNTTGQKEGGSGFE